MWNTVLFDLDGTLTDSGEGITKCVQYALRKEFNINVDDLHDLDSFVGPPLKEQFMEYAGIGEEDAERAIRAYRERYRTRGIYENRVYDGIPELLAQLSAEGMTLAVASSKPTEFCREILRYFGLESYFAAIVGSEMNGTRTKKADVIEAALKALSMQDKRRQVVLVGDRKYDVEGARSVGIGSIGVSFGYGSREELEQTWPDVIADTTEELRNVLIGQYRDGLAGSGVPAGNPAASKDRNVSVAGLPYGAYVQQYGYGVPGDYAPQVYYLPPNAYAPVEKAGVVRQNPSARPALTPSPYGRPAPGYYARPEGESFPYKVWRVLYPFLLDISLSALVANLALAVIILFFGAAGQAEEIYNHNSLLILGITDLAIIPIAAALLAGDERKRVSLGNFDCLLRENNVTVLNFLMLIVFTLCASTLIDILVSYIPVGSSPDYQEFKTTINSAPAAIQFFAVCISGPIMEETLFRGLIYRRLRDYCGFAWAAVISGVFFGAVHGNLVQGVYAAMFGIILALIYEHYGTIWASILAHITNNLSASFGSYVLQNLSDAGYCIYLALCVGLTILLGMLIFSKNRRVNCV